MTIPFRRKISPRSFGRVISPIALTFSGSGFRPSVVSRCPWHGTSLHLYSNFSALSLTPFCWHLRVNPYRLLSRSASHVLWMRVSSANREYFMESAGVRYLRTSCWRVRNRTSERSERVRFLIQKRVHKYCTKHFPCGIVFIIYILRHSSFSRPFYFKSFKNAKFCRYTLTAKWQRKRSISFWVKTFVKNLNDGKDMR